MHIRLSLLLAIGLLAGPALADDKWEVTTSFEMAGMPFQMPSTTQTVCVPPGNDQKLVPADKNCKVTSFSTSGSTSRFHMECSAPQKMSGDGEITRMGHDAYKGKFAARGNVDGSAVDMKMAYAGRRLGTCAAGETTAAKAGAMQADLNVLQAKQGASVKQVCQQMANQMNWSAAESAAAVCPTLKTDICRRFGKLTATPDSLRGVRQQHEDWEQIAGYCGKDPEAMKVSACQAAKQQKIWDAAIDFCPADDPDLKQVASDSCRGINFTAMAANDKRVALAPLCEQYAREQRASSPTGMMDAGKKAMDGINKLRGLFGK